MDSYFNMLHRVADTCPKNYESLRDLTIDVAMSGGYKREQVTLKNGKVVMRTHYNLTPTWDDALVAKWLCWFERLFRSKLLPHPELREFYPDIIQRTFTIYFNALQIDKLLKDGTITTTVYMCLSNRIGEVIIQKGSLKRLSRSGLYKPSEIKNSRDRVVMRSILNYISESFESLHNVCSEIPEESASPSCLMTELSRRLHQNPFGMRLLNSMVYSSRCDSKGKYLPVDFSCIRDYMDFTDKELSSQSTRNFLRSAYRTIINTLKEYYPDYDYDSIKPVAFKFNRISKNVQEACL